MREVDGESMDRTSGSPRATVGRSMLKAVMASALVTVSLAGCTTESTPDNARSTTSASVAEGDPEEAVGETLDVDEKVNRKLARAVDAVLSEEATWFEAGTTVQNHAFMTTSGFATLDGTWKATTTFSPPDEDVSVMSTLSADGSVWMQMEDWPAEQRDCWLPMSATQVPLGVQALMPHEPGYTRILSALTATGRTSSGQITATLDLQAALTLYQAQVVHELPGVDEPGAAGTPVAVVVGVDEDRVESVKWTGSEVVNALGRAGIEVERRIETMLEEMDVHLTYPVRSGDTEVAAPPADLIADPEGGGCDA